MTQLLKSPAPPAESVQEEPILYRLSVDQYHRLIETGILPADVRTELLDGYLVLKMGQAPPHSAVIRRLNRLLGKLVSDAWTLTIQAPITLKESEPEPDLVIVRTSPDDYEDRHPGPRDIALVIEVADSSLKGDRNVKGAIYAQAKIPVYWVVNLIDRQIEVHTVPKAGKNPHYTSSAIYITDQSVPVSIAGQEVGSIAVKDILL